MMARHELGDSPRTRDAAAQDLAHWALTHSPRTAKRVRFIMEANGFYPYEITMAVRIVQQE